MLSPIDTCLREVRTLAARQHRVFVGVAGPPASGKSALAGELADALGLNGITAVVVPMDGFHLDNAVLDDLGLRARKGAPETFDLGGFRTLLNRLAGSENPVYLPVFDRSRDLSVAAGRTVTVASRVLIFEGNYLLFDEPGWRDLREGWDLSIWLDTPIDTVRDRCLARWDRHGLTPEAARARTEMNDLRNARRVAQNRLPADIVFADA
jgi:fructokinase